MQSQYSFQPFDSNELDDVENSLKTNKSPGSDGLGPEFYQQYWEYPKPLHIEMLNESNGKSFCQIVLRNLSLIYKNDKKYL